MSRDDRQGMNKATAAAMSAATTAAITLVVIAVITTMTGDSFVQTVARPSIWLVEGLAIALSALAVLTRPTGGDTETSQERPGPARAVVTHVGWAAAAAVLIGVLLALMIDTPIVPLLLSPEFLVAAVVAVLVAALEAWPDKRP